MAKGRKTPVGGMTIEQLAQRSGVSTRNIRSYQTKGLLPPPEVRPGGRIGIYAPHHLARLRLIARLQDTGHSLAGVANLLTAWDAGHTLDQVLGLDEVVESAREDDSRFIARADLARELPPGFTSRQALAALRGAGVLVAVDGGYELRHPLLLEMAREALRGGIPAAVLLQELSNVGQELDQIAARFVSYFHRYVSGPYVDAGMPIEGLPELQENLQRLRHLAQHLLTPLMSDALDRQIESLMRKMLPRPAVRGTVVTRRRRA